MPQLSIPPEELAPLDLQEIVTKVRAHVLKVLAEAPEASSMLALSRSMRMLAQLTTTQMRLIALRNGGNPFADLENDFSEVLRDLGLSDTTRHSPSSFESET